MKYILTIIGIVLAGLVQGHTDTYSKLKEVNYCWEQQSSDDLPARGPRSEKEWIRLHLSLVEQRLRARTANHLSAAQKQLRLKALDDLHQYWLAGNFPANEQYSYRTPIFIDRHDNFCAVGYLIKASGHEALSREVARRNNIAYVREMHYPELYAWAGEHGFTEAELAWIQPGYPPAETAAGVGGGVDGEVQELYADNASGRLYVGGSFENVDGSLQANNIAYVTEQNGVYTWHSMAGGVNGPVNAITAFDGKIFVAGHFTQAGTASVTNVAYWDGSAWHSAGCTYGTIHDLVVYKNELYASGSFDVCAAMSDVNLAKWNGSFWQQLPGLTGRVNTMEVVNDDLLLGGAFTYSGQPANVIRWNEQEQFQAFGAGIQNEVMDMEWFDGGLYAACKQTAPVQLNSSLYRLTGEAWVAPEFTFWGFSAVSGPPSFNTLCVEGESMLIGGNFSYIPGVGTYGSNFVSLGDHGAFNNDGWFLVDSAINKMVLFKGLLFAGGKFKRDGALGDGPVLNGIARRNGPTTGILRVKDDQQLSLYPNPVASGGSLSLQWDRAEEGALSILDMSGRKVATLRTGRARIQQLQLPSLSPGTYLAELKSVSGIRATGKITVR